MLTTRPFAVFLQASQSRSHLNIKQCVQLVQNDPPERAAHIPDRWESPGPSAGTEPSVRTLRSVDQMFVSEWGVLLLGGGQSKSIWWQGIFVCRGGGQNNMNTCRSVNPCCCSCSVVVCHCCRFLLFFRNVYQHLICVLLMWCDFY